ncbi:MAG: hypothetical protein IIW54_03125 [Lachnospiraceae bacterium]|nr:hypothetical protein [Lachnospiraceae bacterium]
MASHNFSFEDGEILTGIGASWFVSYAYYQHIDKEHTNWDRVATTQPRISKYNKGKDFHKAWLQEIVNMNTLNLSKNTIGLSSTDIKLMATELLEKGNFQ